MTAKRTTVTMLQAGPEGAKFGVFRARVRNVTQRWSWDAHRARLVGVIAVDQGDTRPTYREMAQRFETAEWPAMEYPD